MAEAPATAMPTTGRLAYSHGSARIPGKEGLLPDTGACGNLQGLDHVQRVSMLVEKHGRKVKWEKLVKPKHVAGVGDNTKACAHQAVLPICLKGGVESSFAAPVIDGGVPALYGLDSMAEENTYYGTRDGILAMVPDGMETQIKWPAGTRFIQMEKAPSGATG